MIKINSSSLNNSVVFYLTSSTTNDLGDWNFFLTDSKNTWKSSLNHIEIKTLAVSNGFQYKDYKNLLVSAFCENSNGDGFEFLVNKKESVQDELMLSWFQVLNECKFLLADLKFDILMSNGISMFLETLHSSLSSTIKNAQRAKEKSNTLESDCISLVTLSQNQMKETKSWLEENMMPKFCAILNEKKRKIKTLKSSNKTSSAGSVCKTKIKKEEVEPRCKINKSDNDLTQLPDDYAFSVNRIDKISKKTNIFDNVSDSSDTTIGPDEIL